MQFTFAIISSILLVSGIRSEAEPLTGPQLLKEGGHHEYLFHHGQQHHSVGGGSEVGTGGGNVGVGHLVPSPQIQDQSVIPQEQVSHSGQVGQLGQVGQVGHGGGPVLGGPGSPVVPYVGQSPIGARAIGSPAPYYPYLGKTFASPYYSQYQPAIPYHGVYPQVYPYSAYTASPYSASPYSASPYAAPVSSSVYSGAYPGYNFGYIPQYYSGYPSYYQSTGEVQGVSKQ